jgi:hypothetical protein
MHSPHSDINSIQIFLDDIQDFSNACNILITQLLINFSKKSKTSLTIAQKLANGIMLQTLHCSISCQILAESQEEFNSGIISTLIFKATFNQQNKYIC